MECFAGQGMVEVYGCRVSLYFNNSPSNNLSLNSPTLNQGPHFPCLFGNLFSLYLDKRFFDNM